MKESLPPDVSRADLQCDVFARFVQPQNILRDGRMGTVALRSTRRVGERTLPTAAAFVHELPGLPDHPPLQRGQDEPNTFHHALPHPSELRK